MSPPGRLGLWKIDVEVRGFRALLRSRPMMTLARRLPRVARLPPGRLAVTHADAVHVLRHGRSFGMPYLAKMKALGGVFMLGLDDGPEHARLRAAVKAAIDRCDLKALHCESLRRTEKLLSDLDVDRVEVVGGLIDPVLASTIGRYLGLGELTLDQLADARTVFHDIFINTVEDPRVSLRAQDAATRLGDHVTEVVDERLAGPKDEGDILGRLIAGKQLEPDELINHTKGLLVAWTASVSRAMPFAMDALFKQPDGLKLAKKAACRGDRKAMTAVLTEAFRFVPPAPAVERICRRETPIHGHAVRREAGVIVAITSAMMDARRIDDPGRFRLGRPCEHDLTFGLGSHACLGRELAWAQLSGVMIALLRNRDVRWAYGIKLEGPFPHRLEVTW